MLTPIPIRRRKPSEEGYILVVVMFMLAALILTLAVAAPAVKKSIQRDRDIETMHRGKQYARAVKLYYKKFGAYPPSVDALVNTNMIRFLRKKYIDPTTGKEDWKVIHIGQNKTQTMGFFGQPLGGAASALAGTGPGGAGANPSTGMFNSQSGSSPNFSSANSASTSNPSGAPTDPNAPNGASSAPGAGPGGSSGGTSSTDPNAAGGSSAPGTGTGLTGQTFGGGGVMGFSPNSPKQSILIYKKKNHYNEWEFFYDPLADQMMAQGGNTGTVGQPASSTTTPVGGSSFGGSPTFGGTTGGNTSGGASATPPASPSPQQ